MICKSRVHTKMSKSNKFSNNLCGPLGVLRKKESTIGQK